MNELATGSVWSKFRKKFIGDQKFYRHLLVISVPIMLQSAISNFVSLLDNIMVGRVGTEQMTGVAISNQLFFVFFLAIFGGLAGAGIFTAQYYGKGDDEGVRETFRYKIWMGALLLLVAIAIFIIFGKQLITLYLMGEQSQGDPEAALRYGRLYMLINLIGLPGFTTTQVYAGTMRDCGKTRLPMVAGIIAVLSNLLLDWLLIFGIGPLPTLGVAGAAIATVVARYIEMLIVVIYSHKNLTELRYMKGLYKTLFLPFDLLKNITIKGMPLLLNEFLWSLGMATLVQCYSIRGLEVVAGFNICNTVGNVVNITFISMGDAVAIIVGQLLGAGDMKKAKDSDNKIIAFAVFLGLISSVFLFILAHVFPQIYNTSDEVKLLAKQFMLTQTVFLPMFGFLHTTYFTLRSGGKTIITFIFDSVFMWVISVPVAYCLSRFTGLYAVNIYFIVLSTEIIKCIVGFTLVKKNIWMQNLTIKGD